MAGQSEKIGFTGEVSGNLMCFPLDMKVGSLQIGHIVDISGLKPYEMAAYMNGWLKDQGDLLAIVFREIMDNSNSASEEITENSQKKSFYSADFLHGIYAVSRILFAQAQENMDFGDRKRYPEITKEVYNKVRHQHFDRYNDKQITMRQKFILGRNMLMAEQPVLSRILDIITQGLELGVNRRTDFYGGAAFAYELFRAA